MTTHPPFSAETARSLNHNATYLPPDPADPDTIPVTNLAGIRIGAHVTDEGTLLLGVHYDEADTRLLTHPDRCVPTEVRLNGQPVYTSNPHLRQLEPTTITYTPTTTGRPTSRPLRAFRTGPRHVTAIVTEQGPGTSVTNAPQELRNALQALWPDSTIRQIEHYPATRLEPAHYDEALTGLPSPSGPSGNWGWRRLNPAALATEFGTHLPR
ncbi:hypothetical protein ABZW18_26195 [Streptomyces sp. NPDC004647]|uniref:hypothetical protein n=1 Tax=Streptomyces sp. NPDC004647 TaxID=3154671 RepID=UPI0033B12306